MIMRSNKLTRIFIQLPFIIFLVFSILSIESFRTTPIKFTQFEIEQDTTSERIGRWLEQRDHDELMQKIEDERQERMDMLTAPSNNVAPEIPKYDDPPIIPKTASPDGTISGNDNSSISSMLYSHDPAVRQKAQDYIANKAKNSAILTQKLYDPIYKYVPGQEKFAKGVFGFDPKMSLEENRKFYADQGYTFSYETKDSTFYSIGLGIIILVVIIVILINRNSDYHQKFETQA